MVNPPRSSSSEIGILIALNWPQICAGACGGGDGGVHSPRGENFSMRRSITFAHLGTSSSRRHQEAVGERSISRLLPNTCTQQKKPLFPVETIAPKSYTHITRLFAATETRMMLTFHIHSVEAAASQNCRNKLSIWAAFCHKVSYSLLEWFFRCCNVFCM